MRKTRFATLAVGLALLVSGAVAAPAAAAGGCASHTVGVCRAGSPHPAGATAQCKDGTWSHAEHFRGTCSHHKGVRYWYK